MLIFLLLVQNGDHFDFGVYSFIIKLIASIIDNCFIKINMLPVAVKVF